MATLKQKLAKYKANEFSQIHIRLLTAEQERGKATLKNFLTNAFQRHLKTTFVLLFTQNCLYASNFFPPYVCCFCSNFSFCLSHFFVVTTMCGCGILDFNYCAYTLSLHNYRRRCCCRCRHCRFFPQSTMSK